MASNSRDEIIKYLFQAQAIGIDDVITLLDGASKKSGETATAFGFLEDHLKEIVSLAAAAELAIKGVEFGKESLKNAEAVETSLSRVKALARDAVADFDAMDAAVENAAKAVNVSSLDSAGALAKLVENGLSAKDAIAALIPTLQLAKIANVDVGTAAGDVARALSAFNKPASDAQQVVDQLTEASHGAAGGLAAMSNAAVTLAPDARALNLSFGDVVSVLGVLNAKGLDTEKSVRGLRTVFQELQNPSSALRGELFALGDKTNDFTKAVTALTSGTPRATQALLTLNGPARSLVEVLGQAGPDAIAKFNAHLAETQGVAARTSAVLDDNLGGAARKFELSIESIGEKLAKPILAPFKEELEKLAGEINAFADSKDFKEIEDAAVTMAKNAAKAIDDFLHGIDWKTFASDGKDAIKGLADTLKTMADSASTVASVVGATANTVGAAYHTLGTVVATGVGVAAAGIEDLTGKSEALDVVAQEAAESAGKHFGKLKDDVAGLAQATVQDAAATAQSGTAHADAAPKVEEHAAATERLATVLPTMVVQQNKSILATDEQREAFAKLSEEAAFWHQRLLELAASGHANDDAFRQAQKQWDDSRAALKNLVGSVDSAKVSTGQFTEEMKKIGVVSQQALTEASNTAKGVYEDVQKASDGSKTAIADVQNTFLNYAQKRLAAAAQLGDAAYEQAKQELAPLASINHVTVAYNELTKASDSSKARLVDDADAVSAALQKELNAADKLAGGLNTVADATEKVSEASDHFATSGEEGLAALSQGIGDARSKYSALSEAAAKFYDTVLKGNFDIGHSDDGSGFDKVARAMQAALQATNDQIAANRAQLQGMIEAANQVGTESVGDFNKLGGAAKYTESQIEAMIASVKNGTTSVGILGQQELAPLQAALDAAKQRVDALKSAAEQAEQQLADMGQQLQDDLDQQQGNQDAIEQRRYEKQLADLKAAAQAAGDLNSQQYQVDVDNANKLHALKMKQIADQAAAQKQASQSTDSGGGASTQNNTQPAQQTNTNGGGGSTATVNVVHTIVVQGQPLQAGTLTAHSYDEFKQKFIADPDAMTAVAYQITQILKRAQAMSGP